MNELNEFSDLLNGWSVEKIIHDPKTDYFGCIYKNEIAKQLVMVHSGTDFKKSICSSLFKSSQITADLVILKGNLVLYQAFGYLATDETIKIWNDKYPNFSLTFTGHSLGAWLAELSIFYCYEYDSLGLSTLKHNTKNVKAVTFDGPGSLQMMEKMYQNNIGPEWKLEELDIISYLSPPNFINSVNKHIGCLYEIKLDVSKSSIIKNESKIISNLVNRMPKIVLSNFGHLLYDILKCFEIETGKPESYGLIKKWPIIKMENYANEKNLGIFNLILNFLNFDRDTF